jgi:DNA-binding CsgD family transcriptional regulator
VTSRRRIEERTELSAAELRLLALLARGYGPVDIAARLAYTPSHIYGQLRQVRMMLRARTYSGAVVEGLRRGLIELPAEGEMLVIEADDCANS